MHFSTTLFLSTLLSLAAAIPRTSPNHGIGNMLTKRANPKANEYKTGDCSGPLNYKHQPGIESTCVKMDDTTHSVYLATGDMGSLMEIGWQAFESSDCIGGWIEEQGDILQKGGKLQELNGGEPCVNLDTLFNGKRIGSIYYNICIHDLIYGPTC